MSPVELTLERATGDRRLFVLDGVGTLRVSGLFGRRAVAEAGGRRLALTTLGVLRRVVEAADESGAVVGRFEPRAIRRGGSLRWRERALTLVPASAFRERYVLADGDRELALLDARSWGRRPVRLTVADLEHADHGLLLFAAFVARGLAEDASSAAGAGASAAVIG